MSDHTWEGFVLKSLRENMGAYIQEEMEKGCAIVRIMASVYASHMHTAHLNINMCSACAGDHKKVVCTTILSPSVIMVTLNLCINAY